MKTASSNSLKLNVKFECVPAPIRKRGFQQRLFQREHISLEGNSFSDAVFACPVN